MNKKYYLVALVCAVAGTSVISSCKDTDEDLYTELRNELAFNAGQYDTLSKKLDELAGKIAALKDGKDGKDGKSAYELAVENGFEGDVNAWLESLKGPKGEDGKDGATCDCAIKTAQDVWDVLKEHKILTPEEYQYILDNLGKASASLDIAGVIVQNVYNPAFGTAALPLGIQTNILTSYYSDVTETPSLFPCVELDKGGLTVDELKALGFIQGASMTAAEKKAMKYDLTEAVINVGKVYLTVNPVDVDFAGKTPVLVDVKGKQDGITFSALEACDEDLYFGYTRANTPLYVAKATVTDFGATEILHFNTKENAKQLKEAIQGESVNATKVVKVLYEMLNNVCKRKAVQLTNADNTVVSEYSIAAALHKPFTFETIKAVSESKYMAKLQEITLPSTPFATVNKALTSAQARLKDLYPTTLPAIIVEDAAGAQMMSTGKSNPTPVANEFKLHAVSYCGEIIVPYVYKHVAAVDGPSAAAVEKLNNAVHMNCVINHCDYKDFVIDLAGIEPGVYTLVYSAMDYAGGVEAQRFYFEVK